MARGCDDSDLAAGQPVEYDLAASWKLSARVGGPYQRGGVPPKGAFAGLGCCNSDGMRRALNVAGKRERKSV